MKAKREAGNRYGRLFVLGAAGIRGGVMRWLCRCDCGKETIATGTGLRHGHTLSCGCLKLELFKKNSAANRTHGKAGTSIYRIWTLMKHRCNVPHAHYYHRYGGRGIKVCERWELSFEAFCADMGPRPSRQHSLDRINNDGNYVQGRSLTIAEWSEVTGINALTLNSRLHSGWTAERALTTPSRRLRFHKRGRGNV